MLPQRASLEYLRKLAKDRLREMRRIHPRARLSEAQAALAREHGLANWQALKAEIDRRAVSERETFFASCRAGDVAALRDMLRDQPHLAGARDGTGATALHVAVAHPQVVRLLLEHGADPNARDRDDNALPLHFAAGERHLESVRALLDAGSDVHGAGDRHALEVIGWATVFEAPHGGVVDLLVERGARHHVFSAIALGDPDLLRRVIEADPNAISRRLSRFEQEQTALHYVIAPPDGLVGGTFRTGEHYRLLELLIVMGADVNATDSRGRTPLDLALLRGDEQAMRLLVPAGARAGAADAPTSQTLSSIRRAIRTLTPMLSVTDMRASIAWYESIGFVLSASHGEHGKLDWASLRFGDVEIMLVPSRDLRPGNGHAVSLWIRTDQIDDLYALFKQRQLQRARALMAGDAAREPEIQFTADLHTTFYGQREFSIRDPDGLELNLYQPNK